MTDQTLFDTAETPKACPLGHCQAIRLLDQQKVVTCAHDQAIATTDLPGRRPRGCLNAHDPSTAPLPEGF